MNLWYRFSCQTWSSSVQQNEPASELQGAAYLCIHIPITGVANVHCYMALLHGCWGAKRKSSWSHTCYWLSFLPNPRLRDGCRELSESNHSSGQIMRGKLLNQNHFRGVLSWFRTGNREKLPPHDSFKNWWRKFCLGQPHTFPHYSLDKE